MEKTIKDPVLNALYDWWVADVDWCNDLTNSHYENVAEQKRKKYVSLCKKYGVQPLPGAMRP